MTELFAPPAAVVGGSVVSFASGLPASHREDVYMSTAFAQTRRAQRSKQDCPANGSSTTATS